MWLTLSNNAYKTSNTGVVGKLGLRDILWKCVKVLASQFYLTLCDPMDYSLPSSSVYGILQARILEQVAVSFSRESSLPRDQTQVSCSGGGFFTIWANNLFYQLHLEKSLKRLLNWPAWITCPSLASCVRKHRVLKLVMFASTIFLERVKCEKYSKEREESKIKADQSNRAQKKLPFQ